MNFELFKHFCEAIYGNDSLKTAVLIGACMKIGAILGNASEKVDAIYEFGLNTGMVFNYKMIC